MTDRHSGKRKKNTQSKVPPLYVDREEQLDSLAEWIVCMGHPDSRSVVVAEGPCWKCGRDQNDARGKITCMLVELRIFMRAGAEVMNTFSAWV